MDKFNEIMSYGFKQLAEDIEQELIEWDRTHPEEAKKRDQYIEEHKEEFMEKLMKKIEETGRSHLLSK